MADSLSIVASIVAITGAGWKIAVELNTLAGTVSTASRRVENIANDIHSTCGILNQLRNIIKPMECSDGSQVSIFVEGGLHDILNAANHVSILFDQIGNELAKANILFRSVKAQPGQQVNLSKAQKAKWPFIQPTFIELRRELGDSKVNLLLMLSIANLAQAKKTGQGETSSSKDMKYHELRAVAVAMSIKRAKTIQISTVNDDNMTSRRSTQGGRRFSKIFAWASGSRTKHKEHKVSDKNLSPTAQETTIRAQGTPLHQNESQQEQLKHDEHMQENMGNHDSSRDRSTSVQSITTSTNQHVTGAKPGSPVPNSPQIGGYPESANDLGVDNSANSRDERVGMNSSKGKVQNLEDANKTLRSSVGSDGSQTEKGQTEYHEESAAVNMIATKGKLQAWLIDVSSPFSFTKGNSFSINQVNISEYEVQAILIRNEIHRTITAVLQRLNPHQRDMILKHISYINAELLCITEWHVQTIHTICGNFDIKPLVWITRAQSDQVEAFDFIKFQTYFKSQSEIIESPKNQNQALGDAFIILKDAVGRNYKFPFEKCKSWAGMKTLIDQAFWNVDIVGTHVLEGRYDLIGPDHRIVLPAVWQDMVEPGWIVTIYMWPMPQPAHAPPANAQPKGKQPAHTQSAPANASADVPPTHPPFSPPVKASKPQEERNDSIDSDSPWSLSLQDSAANDAKKRNSLGLMRRLQNKAERTIASERGNEVVDSLLLKWTGIS